MNIDNIKVGNVVYVNSPGAMIPEGTIGHVVAINAKYLRGRWLISSYKSKYTNKYAAIFVKNIKKLEI